MGVDNYCYAVSENIDLEGNVVPEWYAHQSHRSLVLEHDRVHEDFSSRYHENSLNDRIPPKDMYYLNYPAAYEEAHYPKVPVLNCDYPAHLRGHHLSSSFVSSPSEGFYSQHEPINPRYPAYSADRPSRPLSSDPPLVSDYDFLPQYVRPAQYRGAAFPRGTPFPEPRGTRYPPSVHSRGNSHNSFPRPFEASFGASPAGEAEPSVRKLPYACRDYRSGHCTRGERCRFLHVVERQASGELTVAEGSSDAILQNNVQVCRDFLRGNCQRKHCRFVHSFPENTQ